MRNKYCVSEFISTAYALVLTKLFYHGARLIRRPLKIGTNVLMASKIFISDTNHGVYKGEKPDSPEVTPNNRKLTTAPVIIGNNVWIGENAVILAGSIIGDGCIIGANAVVSGEFENNSIIVGVPAKVIKKWDATTRVWELQ